MHLFPGKCLKLILLFQTKIDVFYTFCSEGHRCHLAPDSSRTADYKWTHTEKQGQIERARARAREREREREREMRKRNNVYVINITVQNQTY